MVRESYYAGEIVIGLLPTVDRVKTIHILYCGGVCGGFIGVGWLFSLFGHCLVKYSHGSPQGGDVSQESYFVPTGSLELLPISSTRREGI